MGDETVDEIEAKYISGLSTIMVATIQEAKDRISQIEYIFCSQLFPNFQSRSKAFEKIYSEARLAACGKWKERERTLLSQIEELKVENQQIKSENLVMIKEKEKLVQDLHKTSSMPLKLKEQQQLINSLNIKVEERTKLVQDGMELRNGLVQLFGVEGPDWLSKDERDLLLSEVESRKTKVDFLQEELSKKTLVTENLLKKLEHLSTEVADSERKLRGLEEEKLKLTNRLQVFEENVSRLEGMLRQKTEEIEEGRTALEVLQGKLSLTEREMSECKQKITDHEKQKSVIMGKTKSLGEEDDGIDTPSYLAELQALRKQCEDKSSKLERVIRKKDQIYGKYKEVMSQYSFLLKKNGLTADNGLHQSHLENETTQIGQHEKQAISSSFNRRHSYAGERADKVRVGTGSGINCEKESIIKTMQTPSIFISPVIKSPGVRSDPTGSKSPHLSGSKRPASIWRETRSRQSPGGHDPHDDFLDTPIENVKRVAVEEKHNHSVPKKDDSDDETQDMNPKRSPSRQRIQVAETSKKGFKHVESVRKKAERENLKGIECKQCKKFYDAVLPENEGNGKNLRCEHHEGVSRHRYKYAPPMTPEGFWNIGFESEM